MGDLHGNEPLTFSFWAADALKTAFTNAATDLDGQKASRASAVTTGKGDFSGLFADVFAENAEAARVGATNLSARLREVAGWVGEIMDAAERENARRKRARDYFAELEARSGWDKFIDGFTGAPEAPQERAEAPLSFTADAPATARETPAPGSGSGGSTSSARPSNLRSFASTTRSLDEALASRPASLTSAMSTFDSECDYGTIDASGLVRAFDTWLSANGNDASWATTVADDFAQAGGEGDVSTVSNAALAASLQAAGIAIGRDDLVIEPPQAYGGAPTSGYSVDPVNTTTGNFLEAEVDLAFAGASHTLRLNRMYNSLDTHVGLFGPGWASVLETRLVLDDEGAVLTMGDGRQVVFPRLGEGWDRGVGENFWLAAEGSTLVVRDAAGSRWRFTPSGVWLGTDGGAGTAVEVARHPDGLPARLTHARGRWIEIDYVDGRVAVATGSDGRRVEYAYDDQGRLVGATSEVGTRRYDWNDAGLVEKVTSASGVVEAVNAYDDRGRVVEQLTPHGRTVRFAYLRGRVTVVSDVDGSRSNSWISDPKGRLVGVLDSDDQRQSMSYDPHGNLVSVVERDGSTTVHGYDDRGRKVRTVTASGADLTWGYDDLDRVTTVVTESGAVVQYEYDGDDRDPSAIVDPEGGRSELVWRDGLLERVVDPTGVTVTCSYDAFGDLVATTNAVGDVARIERDQAGRPVVAISPSGARTTYAYDAAGLLVSRRDPDGATWRFEHGPGARTTAVVDPLGARTEFGYGPHGELETTTDPLGRVVSRRFDDQGNLSAVVLPDGGENRFAWDAHSRLRTVTDPAGHDWTREYDVTGALTATVDPTGIRQEARVDRTGGTSTLRDAFTTTTVRFDEFGRPVATEAADGSADLITYDRCGRVVELVDGEGGLTRLERDAAGRVTAVVTPTGARTSYEYDACGRPSASTDPLGARTTLSYDADSRVVARTLPTGEVERIDHDAAGRVVARRVPGQGTARFGYDAAGRLTSTQDTRYGQRRFRYDAAGQLVEAINGLGGITRYEYDQRGRVVAITDPLGGVTRREHDAVDRVTRVVDPLGRTTTAEYDAAGRQLLQRDPDGHVTRWRHDTAGRPAGTSVDGRETAAVTVDPTTRTVTVVDHTAGAGHDVEQRLEYDRRGGLVRRARGASSIAWEYDADGRRTARVDPDGTRTEYRRDTAGRVVSVVHAGVESTVSYDAAGRIVGSAGGDLMQAWRYDDGALVEHTMTGADGAVTTTITRDASDRIARIDGPAGTVEYGYDDACQLTSLRTGTGGLTTWTYDRAGRLVAETRDGVTTTSTHDAAGQLVARDLSDGRRLEYVHDGLGRRVREIADDGAYTEYAWSDLGWLEAVVRHDADAVVLERTSLWVDALGELATVDGADVWWDTASTLPSLVSLGGSSVTTLPGGATRVGEDWLAPAWRGAHATDATDPWGAGRASSVTGPDLPGGPELPGGLALTATGGLQVAGLDWLGARVYDPTARGFLSVDPLAPVTGAAWAGNPYSYAGNDPLHALDPLGLRPATDADLADYATATQGAWAAAGAWWDDNWEYVAAGAAIVGGVALMATGVGGPAGIALMAASGALLSGGISVASQKATTGEVDWGKAGTDALIGGVLGGASAGASSLVSAFGGRAASLLSSGASRVGSALTNAGGRVGSAVATAGQQAFGATARAATSQIGMNTISNAVVGGAGNVGTYYVTTPQSEWNLTDAGGSFVGGFVSGGLTANAGAAADALPAALSALRPVVRYGIGSVGSAGGGLAERGITGEDYSVADIGFDVVGGSVMTHFPGAAELGATNAVAHVGTAWAGQHASWMMDGTQFVLEQTGVLP